MNSSLSASRELQLQTFDIDEMLSLESEERKKKFGAFVVYLKEYGFAGIKVNDLEPIISKAYQLAQGFFSCPAEEKAKPNPTISFGGYQALGTENLASFGQDKPVGDYKEAFLFMGKSRIFQYDKEGTLSIFHDKMGLLANKILTIILEYFNTENPEKHQLSSNSEYAVTRLTFYPPMKKEMLSDPKMIWCTGHYDISPITLLPKATTSGLQIKREDKWINIDAPDGEVILNTGRLFETLTAGLFKPTYHRVCADEVSAEKGRYSIIYFASWETNYEVEPLKNFLKLATDNMSEEERRKYCAGLLCGQVEKVYFIFAAIAGNINVSDEQKIKWAKEFPDNASIKAAWPWAFNENNK